MRATAASACILLMTGTASAGPLHSDRVAADARWVVHLDMEAFRASTIGQLVLEEGDRFDIDTDDFDEFADMTGLDPRTDLMSLTAYGSTEDFEDDVVVVAVTNEAADEAMTRLMESEDVRAREIEEGGHEMVRFRVNGDRFYVHLRRLDRDRRLLVIAPDRNMVAHALDVIEGDAPSASMGRDGAFLGRPQRHSIVYVAASGIEHLGDIEPASEILRLSDGFTLDIGEDEGELTARAAVSAQDEETAQQIVQVAQGIVALGQLIGSRQSDLQPLARLAGAVRLDNEGTTIVLRFRYDTERLVRHLEDIQDADFEHWDGPRDRERQRERRRHRDRDDDEDDDD